MARLRALMLCLPWVAACASPRIDDGRPAFTEVESVLQDRCLEGCHEPGGYAYWHDMSGDTYERIVGNRSHSTHAGLCALIEPGEPAWSLIWHKIVGTQGTNCNAAGLQMPLDRENLRRSIPLPADEIELIEAWILAGAPP